MKPEGKRGPADAGAVAGDGGVVCRVCLREVAKELIWPQSFDWGLFCTLCVPWKIYILPHAHYSTLTEDSKPVSENTQLSKRKQYGLIAEFTGHGLWNYSGLCILIMTNLFI
jgi:hypothetical protein